MAILDLATYKNFKGINSTEEDTKITNTINAVNAFIEAYTGRVFTTFFAADNVEYYSSKDTELFPTEHPIQTITELAYSGDNGLTYSNVLVEFTDYIIDKDNESIISVNSSFATTQFAGNAIRLTYQGGYLVVPNDLQLAAAHLTDYYIEEEYTPRKSMAGSSTDNVIQPDMTMRLPAHIRRVLESYRNIVF